jgi:predicted Zn-dependent peptidase
MKFNKQVLKSGLRLITIPMADNPSVTVLVVVETGSKYETKETNGISHFLEHMVFKGTPKRPSASDISRELDSIGAQYNAFTSQEFTGYYAKAASRHIGKIIDVVSDMCINPIFDEKEIAKEKGVIIEELRMYRDLPQKHVQNVMGHLLHGDQPAGWEVIGTEETIKSFTRDTFLKYRNEHYVSKATTVIISGSFDEKDIAGRIEEAFSGVLKGDKKGKLPVKADQKAPAISVEPKETDQTHLVIAVRTFPVLDKRIPVMNVMSAILGGGMSSRLFSRMRDELGICYYIRASHDSLTDHGDLSISAGVDNARVETAIKEILAQCERLKEELVSPEELKKAKDYIAGTIMLELETSDARAEFAGLDEAVKGRIDAPEEVIRKVGEVTSKDVQKLARQIFVNEGLNLALIGRSKKEALMPLVRFS